jgi:hypothetical protein
MHQFRRRSIGKMAAVLSMALVLGCGLSDPNPQPGNSASVPPSAVEPKPEANRSREL